MVGIAGVVAVLLGVLSIREGFRKTLVTAGSPSVASCCAPDRTRR
jgi:hypothetical protein